MNVVEARNYNVNRVLKILDSREKGLSGSEAAARLEKYGYNEITERKPNQLLKLLKKFFEPVPLLLWMSTGPTGLLS